MYSGVSLIGLLTMVSGLKFELSVFGCVDMYSVARMELSSWIRGYGFDADSA